MPLRVASSAVEFPDVDGSIQRRDVCEALGTQKADETILRNGQRSSQTEQADAEGECDQPRVRYEEVDDRDNEGQDGNQQPENHENTRKEQD